MHKGVEGMLGSLDCMHVYWKNWPVAWQGSQTGKPGKPTIVLEAFADYNLWFWHSSFGWPGSLNDINI
jgi:Plant transposon protein